MSSSSFPEGEAGVTEGAHPRARFLDSTTPPTIGTLIAITGVAGMALNIFLPVLPDMAQDLGVDYGVIQLSVGLYLAFTGLAQIFLGPLADRYGRRPLLLACYGIFALASLGCALAATATQFLICRMFQAVVFSGVILARTIVRDTVPEARAASVIGYVTMGMAVVPMLSPALGGTLAAAFGWRACFWLLFAMGLFAVWLSWRDVGETRPRAFASFAEQVRGYPELFRAPRFWGYSLVLAFAGGTFFAYLGAAPFVGAQVFGLDPVTLGILFGATSLGYATGSFLSGRLSQRAGVRRMVLAGTLTSTIALGLSLALFLVGAGSVWSFFGFTIFMGIGYGMTLPNATSGLLSVRPHLAGTASGIGGAIMILLGAALSALAGALMVPDTGAERLLAIQVCSSLLSLAATLFVRARERGR